MNRTADFFLKRSISNTLMCFFFFFFFFFFFVNYKNLNKITKNQHISLKFNRLLIFVILYSLQCKNMLFKSVLIRKDQREFLVAKI